MLDVHLIFFHTNCLMVYVPVAQWLEHCVSSKGCGFDSQGTHVLTKNV